MPGIDYEYALHERFLPEITLAEVNALAKDWVPDGNRVVLVNAPEKAGLTVPDEAKLAAVIAAATARTCTAYVDTVGTPAAARHAAGAPARSSKTTTKDAVRHHRVGAGQRRQGRAEADDVQGGRSPVPGVQPGRHVARERRRLHRRRRRAAQVVARGGLGKFSAVDLRKMLTGKVASARPFIGELEEGLRGSASRKDLETMFQLIYLTFTQPRADPAMFSVMHHGDQVARSPTRRRRRISPSPRR